MAVKWAVANGNWSAGATWNDGVVPTVDDDVYANGYTISVMPVDVSVKSLHNDANNDYSINAGGYFDQTHGAAPSITANIISVNSYCVRAGITSSTGGSLTIYGDILCSNTLMAVSTHNVNRTHTFIVNGNVTLADGCAVFGSDFGTWRFTIVGNMSAENNAYIYNGAQNNAALTLFTYAGNITNVTWSSVAQTITTCNGSGNWQVPTSQTVTTATITGNVILKANTTFTTANITGAIIANGLVLAGTTLNLNGNITYIGTNGRTGVRYTTLNILNPDTFTWKDVTEPRINPFIILTDAEMNNRQQYPAENEVKQGTEYVWGQKVGTYLPDYPPESVVLDGYIYDNGDKTGSMSAQAQVGCVTKEDVREGVPLIGMYEEGQQVVGTIVIPAEDDVREGVVFDNGTIGTLIVQGGGDRLRIADFGYYTRSTSITYIVDLTESDKPAFADCEEIVLRSLFPTLDLDNIPDKFFDDLFVQFLRYRLLVEYYRGTSINSKFTPSEPTTEIVNYANTKCEYWLNTANLFLQLWGEKYPNSVKKDRILL